MCLLGDKPRKTFPFTCWELLLFIGEKEESISGGLM